jgi:hypothetical protein
MENNKPEYTLEKSVTGTIEKPTPVILEDKEGNKLRAPWIPNSKCKKCYGRGFIGKNVETGELEPCRKCYPFKKY